ncbi:MAG: type II toxin-antitoxin system HicB family antitoxin [Clostridia bacterium]|nr:type II toxin-antitoxin system HicB family antitoxin [Clostridia bacterium]
MRTAYPVVFESCKDGYVAYIPDFDCNSEGDTLAEAIEMARDAIGLMGIDNQDDGLPVPDPSNYEKIAAENTGKIVTMVDIDFDEYRKANETKSVRRNVTLPAWLDYEATKAKVNVSAILKDALISTLNLTPKY